MGIGDTDLRIDIQQTDDIAEKSSEVARALENDGDVSAYVVLTTHTFRARTADGSVRRLTVELGDHGVFPINYAVGRAPAAADEIALSVLNAEELNKGVGDSLRLLVDGQERELTVSGLYSDVTNGGKTAKALFAAPSTEIMWSVIGAELAAPSLVDEKVTEYASTFEFAKVSGIDEFTAQTYGSTIKAIGTAARVATGVALTLIVLINLLFMRMLVAKDRYAIAVMKAFGFTNSDIRAQYAVRAVFVLVVSVLIGTLLANTLGEALAGAVIASFGASSFTFVVNPLAAYLVSPLLMTFAVLAATLLGTLDAGKIKIAEGIRE
jgi:putative ABC transport system permease protein